MNAQPLTVNQAAFGVSTLLAMGTLMSAVAVSTATGPVGLIAYTILGIGFGSASVGSITAWLDPKSTDVKRYLDAFKQHTVYAFAGTFQLVSNRAMQAVVEGLCIGVTNRVAAVFDKNPAAQSAQKKQSSVINTYGSTNITV